MLSRFTVTGINKAEEVVLLAYQLHEQLFKLNLYATPKKSLTAEQVKYIENNWVNGEEFEFGEASTLIIPNLNADSILPEDIKSEETGKIRTKQNEWAYQLLTAKLWESYLLELDELKKRAAALIQYDRQLFDESKAFWERVLEHKKQRDISQSSLDKIKDDVNAIFEKLKTFRKTESVEFEQASVKLRDELVAKIDAFKAGINDKSNFKELQEDLKTLQNESRKSRYTKTDDAVLKKAFDTVFHFINQQRNLFFNDKTAIRIKGLTEVIQKMEISLQRDKKDLEYLEKKANGNNLRSLELQLINVKKNLLNDTIASKEDKLKDIRSTLDKIQKPTAKAANEISKAPSKPNESNG